MVQRDAGDVLCMLRCPCKSLSVSGDEQHPELRARFVCRTYLRITLYVYSYH
jgi:hypothetical protein